MGHAMVDFLRPLTNCHYEVKLIFSIGNPYFFPRNESPEIFKSRYHLGNGQWSVTTDY